MILILSCAFSLLITVIAVFHHREKGKFRFTPLVELWTSFVFMHLMIMLTSHHQSYLIPLMMLGWLWPIRAIWRYLNSFQTGLFKGPFLLQGLGVGLALSFLHIGHSFTYYMLPFFIGFALTGICFVWSSIRSIQNITDTFRASVLSLLIFMLLQLAVPFWTSQTNLPILSLMVNTILLMVVGASTLLATFENQLKEINENLEERLFLKEEDLFGKAKFSELGIMSAGIAHEINNPLAIIQARTTQLLRIYRKPEHQKDLAHGLQQILYTSERIERTIKGVREFFYQTDQMPDQTVSLEKLMDNVLAFCGQRLKNHGIELRLLRLENIHLKGHEVQLEQVFLNLINNSFDAIDKQNEKWIEISTIKNKNTVEIFFKDSGPGIPDNIAKRMMEPFFSTKGSKGTGLGLALINAIIGKHGGSFTYIPNAPTTTFLIELPLDESSYSDSLPDIGKSMESSFWQSVP